MNGARLISSILTGLWAIDPVQAQGYFPLVSRLISGEEALKESDQKVEPESRNFERSNSSSDSDNHKTVAVLSYKNVVLKSDQPCGGHIGTDTLAKQILQAASDPNIAAIVIDWDTPGGATNATQFPSQAIQDARENKPVISYFGNGMLASAGYFIAANSDEIYATYKMDSVGSIGTYMTIMDMKAYAESQGHKIHEIYASKSTNKNGAYRQLLEASSEEEIKAAKERLQSEMLDPFNQLFLDTVTANREGIQIDSEVLTGKMYLSEKAIEMNLIDGIKTFDQVIERAFELSDNYSKNKSKINSKNMFGKQFKSLTSFAKSEVEDRTPEMLDAVNQDLQKSGIEGFLMEATEGISSSADVEKALSDAADSVSAANTEKATAEKNAADLQAQLDAANTRITVLESESAGDSRQESNTTDELDSESIEKTLASLPHNQKADNLF